MEELLKVQGPTKVKGMGCQEGLPRLPEMHGQRATTSVWPSVHLRGTGTPKHPLMFDRRVATTASESRLRWSWRPVQIAEQLSDDRAGEREIGAAIAGSPSVAVAVLPACGFQNGQLLVPGHTGCAAGGLGLANCVEHAAVGHADLSPSSLR